MMSQNQKLGDIVIQCNGPRGIYDPVTLTHTLCPNSGTYTYSYYSCHQIHALYRPTLCETQFITIAHSQSSISKPKLLTALLTCCHIGCYVRMYLVMYLQHINIDSAVSYICMYGFCVHLELQIAISNCELVEACNYNMLCRGIMCEIPGKAQLG